MISAADVWKPVSDWQDTKWAAEKAIAALFADWKSNSRVLYEHGIHFGKRQHRYCFRCMTDVKPSLLPADQWHIRREGA